MAASKGTGPFFTWGGVNSSSASGTSDVKNTAADYADTVFGTITITGTVTVGPSVQLQESPDGTTMYNTPACVFAPGTAVGTYPFRFQLDPTSRAADLVYAAGTGGTCTISAQFGQLQG